MLWLTRYILVLTSSYSTSSLQENAQFVDGDDYHSRENVKKMSSGQPLTDQVYIACDSCPHGLHCVWQDRIPWLESLHQVLYEWVHDRVEGKAEGKMRGVLACSALKRNYRDLLTGRGQGVRGQLPQWSGGSTC